MKLGRDFKSKARLTSARGVFSGYSREQLAFRWYSRGGQIVQRLNKGNFRHLLLCPFILATNLILLLGCKIVLDIEGLTNLLRRLALDHIRNGLAANIK